MQKSLHECGLGYIDLYLIHGPIGGPRARKESWQAICDAHKLRSVGVSTFGVRHMQEIIDTQAPLPTINQIDLYPCMTRTDVVVFCKKYNIALEAWAPLVRGLRLNQPLIARLAEKHSKTSTHILYTSLEGIYPAPKIVI